MGSVKYVYLCIIVILNSNIWNIHGQESDSNKTTNIPVSGKPVSKYPYQTDGFNSSSVTSGPILIIDKKIIFISNLNYNASDPSTHFWAGTDKPSSNGDLVLDQNNSEDALKSYKGRNLYLRLPGDLTTDKIDYLGIWSSENDNDVGHVLLYANVSDEVRNNIPEASGFHQITEDKKIIFRVPKCCEVNSIYDSTSGCVPSDTETRFEFDRVFASNETHINTDERIENIEFIPYSYYSECPEDYIRIVLEDSDTFGLIFNSSLLYADRNQQGLKSHGEFCMENLHGNETNVVMCLEPVTTTANMPNLYFPFLIISTICFLSSALCYIFILQPKDVHKQCFIGYSSSMTFTFLCLILLQKLESGCNFVGGLFILFMLCSFVWFTCLCVDLIFVIKSFKKCPDNQRLYYYIGLSIVIPLIFLISSLVPDGIPDVPQSFVKKYSEEKMCHFEDTSMALFFTPIGILILISLSALCYSSYFINTNNSNDHEWVSKKDNFKFISRSCALIWTTTCIWLIELLVYVLSVTTALSFAIDLIEASQGIFVLFIFALNKYTRKEMLDQLENRKAQKDRKKKIRYTLVSLLNKDNFAAVGDEGVISTSEHEGKFNDNKYNGSDHAGLGENHAESGLGENHAESQLGENKQHERP